MKSPKDILQEFKNLGIAKNDADIARLLDVSRNSISMIHKGGSFSDDHSLVIAELLNRSPIQILAINKANKAKTQKCCDKWMEIAENAIMMEKMLSDQREAEAVQEA